MRGIVSVAMTVTGMSVALLAAGCGVSDSKLESLDNQIDSLARMGVPDSILTEPKVQVAEARGYKKAANMGQAARSADSAALLLSQAGTWYEEQMQKLGPEIASVKESLAAQQKELSGPNLRFADSIIAIADSFATTNWLLQARAKLATLEKKMPLLRENERTGKKLRPKVVGTWREIARPDGPEATSVVKTVYTFKPDGSLESSESKKGKSSEALKENWAFSSWGKWELKGDTILMHIEREKCHRQIYDNLVTKDGKQTWKRTEGPPYDSTFTDNRKDRTMAFVDLKDAFNKIR